MRAGRFITFEGPEGGGKTTQAKRLLTRLRDAGRDVLYTREPGGTPTGEAIREILQHDKAGEPLCDQTEVFLFAASRAQLVRRVILPALERGTVVVCDRFADSTTAYQGYGRGFSVEQMLAINAFAIDGAEPDVTLLLDLPIRMGFERVEGRQRQLFEDVDRIEREAREFHERVRNGYLELATRWPTRFRTIDATRTPDEVEQTVWEIVQGVLA
ncbi:MAG: dTMP kinase [Verrucomicrobia bacterium]|nr:dTMP kinase [Kiritimatiellia bacterium]MCO6401750.1 dTMP kinase [Verrucomicrobiota bacterium]